jgi:hypothetical protein
MDIRHVPASQGLAWFAQAINLGARNPKAVFGAALLFIAALWLVAFALGLAARAAMGEGEPDLGRAMLLVVPMFLAIMLLAPVLLGGLMHVIREAEAGRPVRATDLFAPFRQGRAPRLAALGVVQVLLGMLGGVLMVAIAGADYWQQYMEAMQGAMSGRLPAMPQPEHPLLLMLVQLAFNYFSYALMLLSIPLILFGGATLAEAIRDSLRASVRNIGANLLAGLLFVLGVLVAAVVVLLFAGFVTLLGNLVHPALGAALSTLVLLGFGAVLLVVLTGGAYLAWRDTFEGPAPAGPAAPNAGIEA